MRQETFYCKNKRDYQRSFVVVFPHLLHRTRNKLDKHFALVRKGGRRGDEGVHVLPEGEEGNRGRAELPALPVARNPVPQLLPWPHPELFCKDGNSFLGDGR